MTDDTTCWYCNGTGVMFTLVNKEGQPVATTSEGWPIGTDISKFHWEERPCKHCGLIREPRG